MEKTKCVLGIKKKRGKKKKKEKEEKLVKLFYAKQSYKNFSCVKISKGL